MGELRVCECSECLGYKFDRNARHYEFRQRGLRQMR